MQLNNKDGVHVNTCGQQRQTSHGKATLYVQQEKKEEEGNMIQ